jgi:peptidoglycan hydrolase-like protein with peptidoglycan-binding domain
MRKNIFKFSVLMATVVFFITGCATTRARKTEPVVDQNAQVTELQKQLQTKDQEIQDLQYQLANNQQSIGNANYSANGSRSKSDKASFIRVSGVTVLDVQKALIRAGYDPGPADGQAGKKTKSAIKKFQKKHHLTTDGIIGEKTWNLLK